MTMSDPIADMLTRIRNANTAKHDTVDVPASKMKLAIAEILLKEGYITKYEVLEDGVFKTIHITLKYGADKTKKLSQVLREFLNQVFVYMQEARKFLEFWVDWVLLFCLQTRALLQTKKQENCM